MLLRPLAATLKQQLTLVSVWISRPYSSCLLAVIMVTVIKTTLLCFCWLSNNRPDLQWGLSKGQYLQHSAGWVSEGSLKTICSKRPQATRNQKPWGWFTGWQFSQRRLRSSYIWQEVGGELHELLHAKKSQIRRHLIRILKTFRGFATHAQRSHSRSLKDSTFHLGMCLNLGIGCSADLDPELYEKTRPVYWLVPPLGWN